MKKRYALFVLFAGFLFMHYGLAQPQKAEVTYKVKLHRQDNKNEPRKKLSERLERVLKEVDNISLRFLYNNGKATFKAEDDPDPDKLTKLNRSSAKTIAGVRDDYYYNVPEKEIAISTPGKGKKVTEKEFEKIASAAYGNYIDLMKNQ